MQEISVRRDGSAGYGDGLWSSGHMLGMDAVARIR